MTLRMGNAIRWQQGLIGLITLFFLAFLLPSHARAADPIEIISVPNNGYEQSLVAGKIPGWSAFGIASNLSLSNTKVFAGSQSLKMNKPQTGGLGAESTKLPVTAGQSYEAKIKLYLDSYSGGAPALWIRWYDAAGQFMNKQATYGLSNPALQTWMDVRVSGVAPEGAAFATIFPYASSSVIMSAYVDETQFYRIDPNFVEIGNPGFEDAASGTNIPGWELYPATPSSAVSVTTSVKKSGTSSLHLLDTLTDKPAGLSTQGIGVHAGGIYQAKASVYLASGEGVALYIKFYDSTDKEVGTISRVFTTPLNTWSDVLKVEGIAPDKAVKAKVLLYSGVGTLNDAYFDDTSLTYKGEALKLPFAFENAVNLGKATVTTTNLGGAFGNGELYFVTNGNPGVFYAVDAATGTINNQIPVTGTTETWAVTVGADNNVYFAATANRNFYKFDTRPGYRNVTLIGSNPSDNFVWDLDASSDGIIYGSTSPNAKVFTYNTQTQAFEDLGRMHPTEQYARGAGVDDQYLFVGIGSKKHLIRVDRSTGVKTEIPMPFTGLDDFVHNITIYNGLLYVTHGTSLVVVNEQSLNVLKSIPFNTPEAFDGKISPPSPSNADLLYYRNKFSNNLWSYQVSTNSVQQVTAPNSLLENGTKAFGWVTLPGGGQKLAILYDNGQYSLWNPTDNSIQTIQPTGVKDGVPFQVSREGVNIQSMAAGSDKKLYLGGFIDGMSVFNQETQTYDLQVSAPESPHQVEEIGFLNGKTYFGAYGGARIYAYDATQPYHFGTTPTSNPKLVNTIPNLQDRPYVFASGDNRLFIGTIPGYGSLGGSLTTYDETTGLWQSTRNVVTDQSIISLAYKDGILFGGTAIEGGLGSTPAKVPATETEPEQKVHAKLFKWDANTNTKLAEFEPVIAGLSSPSLFGGLSFGPDGLLWGIAWGTGEDNSNIYALYALNPSTLEVVKSKLMYSGANGGSPWRSFYLRWGQDGLLYTTIARYVTVFDPNTLKYRPLSDMQTNLMDIGMDGSIYYTYGPTLYKIPVRISQASIGMAHTTLSQGTSEPVIASGILENGLPAILAGNGNSVTYKSSDPTVISVVNGQVQALKEGTASLYADITLNGKTIRSNTINVTITPHVLTGDEVKVQLKDSAGNPLSGGTISYYDGGWKDFGVTDASGSIIKSLSDKNYSFAMSYEGTRNQLTQNTGINPVVTFQTVNVQAHFNDSQGLPLGEGTVSYYGGSWRTFGTINAGKANKQLLPGSYTFAINYDGAINEKVQNVGLDPHLQFQTVMAQVYLTDSGGNPLSGGNIAYYSGSWKSFGVTNGSGLASKELLAKTYTFSMTYAGTRNEKTQQVGTGSNVPFQTTNVKVVLRDAQGNPVEGTISYYGGSWLSFGETTGDEVNKELLAGTYTLSAISGGIRKQMVVDTVSNPMVVFQY